LRKKDDRIIQLEKKVEELTKKLNLLTNRNNNNISSTVNPFENSAKKICIKVSALSPNFKYSFF
jgi:archaellum component FlaC